MDYQMENLILRFVKEDDLSEVARVWPAEHHPLSNKEAMEAISYMSGNYARNTKGSILKVLVSGYSHWILYYHGKYYDPEFGLMDELYSRAKIQSYLELLVD